MVSRSTFGHHRLTNHGPIAPCVSSFEIGFLPSPCGQTFRLLATKHCSKSLPIPVSIPTETPSLVMFGNTFSEPRLECLEARNSHLMRRKLLHDDVRCIVE